MKRFIVVRLAQAALTLWLLSLAVFLSVHLTGDPAAYLLGPELGSQEYEQLKKNLGLDRPLIVQYGDFMLGLTHLDFGRSAVKGIPARDLLLQRLPATLELALSAFVLSIIVGVPIGILSAVKRDTIFDHFGKLFAVIGIAAPSFWVAIMGILLFLSLIHI